VQFVEQAFYYRAPQNSLQLCIPQCCLPVPRLTVALISAALDNGDASQQWSYNLALQCPQLLL
jgi:hypothetical protein